MSFSLVQWGLLLDAVGFTTIFMFGGFSFGLDFIVLAKAKWFVLPAKVLGGVMVLLASFCSSLVRMGNRHWS